ncbi:hypothetical protein T492DRAFT_598095 [Pavlovales sp. CCMP2436]|nr:hypothetical protein T492DRAFT_598095 [Pavlovales sp. CCMP2436]
MSNEEEHFVFRNQLPATAQQLGLLEHFAVEERHFHVHSLLTTACAICLERIILGESATRLPKCRHVYHRECIMPWLSTRKATCPTCRQGL